MRQAFDKYEQALAEHADRALINALRESILLSLEYNEKIAYNEALIGRLTVEANKVELDRASLQAKRLATEFADKILGGSNTIEFDPPTDLDEALGQLEMLHKRATPIRQVMLIRDLAAISGHEALALMTTARRIGLGNYSINMEIKIEDAVSLINYLNSPKEWHEGRTG